MIYRPRHLIVLLSLTLLSPAVFIGLGGCEARGESTPPRPAGERAEAATAPEEDQAPKPGKAPPKPVEASTLAHRYKWLAGDGLEVVPLDQRFSAPSGYTRVEVEAASFGAFLRHLPIRTDRTKVRSYADELLSSPSAGVVAIDVGDKNLQQCADTAIRLHAEYLWSANRRDELAYHFTSGDETRWTDWKDGERFEVSGASVKRVQRRAVKESHAAFRSWLDTVFMYAGTRSLRLDSQPVAQNIEPGDFFVAPGSPGHAVIVLDVAHNSRGRRIALLGQGFMPAQELHVIRARGPRTVDGLWFMLPEDGQTLDTPSWRPFSRSQARRFAR